MPLIYLITLIFLTSGVHVSLQSEDEVWAYSGDHGPDKWEGLCKNGKAQSPIDIETDHTIRDDLGNLKFTRYDFAFAGKVTNNGHTIQITLSGVPLFLSGGGLTSTYVFEQMHFHWGAEHTIDGVRDALELHLVHFDKKYENVSVAAAYPKGVAVLGVLFKLSDDDNKALYPILRATKLVSDWVGPNSIEIQDKVVPQMILPKDRTSFYKYEGSLTTPSCAEAVTWFVLTEKVSVSQDQLDILSKVETPQGPLKFNYRPTQSIGNRKVYHHLLGYSSAAHCVDCNLTYTTVLSLISLSTFSLNFFSRF